MSPCASELFMFVCTEDEEGVRRKKETEERNPSWSLQNPCPSSDEEDKRARGVPGVVSKA